MRIVAGERGGARLQAPRGGRVRPTGERAREAIFAMLGDVSGLDVLDAFAGTGAMGLEALSRGAASAVFCETDPAVLRLLRANVERLGYAGRADIHRGDATRRLAADVRAGRRYHLVFLDPPYAALPDLAAGLRAALPAALAPGGLAVLESSARAEPADLGLAVDAARAYGDASVTILRHA